MTKRSRNRFNSAAMAIVLAELDKIRSKEALDIAWAIANPLDPRAVEILSAFDTEPHTDEESLKRIAAAKVKRQAKAVRRGWIGEGDQWNPARKPSETKS